MKTEYWNEETPFVNEECGDTLWNDENLNPPKSNDMKQLSLEDVTTEPGQDLSTSGNK